MGGADSAPPPPVIGLTLAGRKGGWCHPPQTVLSELLENGAAERRQILAMLPYIQGGPDDVFENFRVRSGH